MSRTRFATWAYGTSMLFTAVTVTTGLVSTPLLLRWLGAERLGAYRATSDWFGYVALLDFGVSGAMQSVLSRALQRHPDDVRSALAAARRQYGWALRATVLASLVFVVVISTLVPVRTALRAELRLGCLTAGLSAWLGPFCAPSRLLLEARQETYRLNLRLLAQAMLTTAAGLLFARLGWGIPGQFFAAIVGSWPYYAPLLAERSRGQNADRTAAHEPADPEMLREIRRLSAPSFVLALCGRLSLMTDNITVAAVLGPAAVVPFALTQRLPSLVQGQLQAVGNAAWAGLGQLYHQGERQLFNRRVVDLTRLVAIVGVAALLPIVIGNQQFVTRWVGGDYYAGAWLTVLAALNALLQALFSFWGWCFSATGKTPMLARMTAVQTAVNVVASVSLTRWIGLLGPVMGTSVAFTAVSVWCFPVLMRRSFGIPIARLVAPVVASVALGVALLAVVRLLGRAMPSPGTVAVAGQALAATVVYCVVCWTVLLSRSERSEWTARTARILGREPVLAR